MATTLRSLTDEVLNTVKGYGLHQSRSTYLSTGVDAAVLSFSVNDAANMDQGIAEIEDELVFIDSVDRTTNTLTIAPDGRGEQGTTAAAHAANKRIDFNPVWSRLRVRQAINDVILSTHPVLFGVGVQQFTFTPSVTTYSLPADADGILSVTADTLGPSRQQQRVCKYSFNSVAPVDDWATGNTVTLHESVAPGRTVTVTYKKQPTELAADGDLLTASGLRETAKRCIVYGACSQIVSFMDVARLPVDTAQADEYDERNSVGTATRIAGQLEARFQMELEKERARLRAATPVPINVRIR